MANNNNVFVGNYDLALFAVCDRAGHGRIGWVDVKKGEARIGKSIIEMEIGENSEQQANMLSLLAGALHAKLQNQTGRKVLLVMTDAVAPRYFEIQKTAKTAESAEDVVATVVKSWMPEQWAVALEDMVTAYAEAIEGGNFIGGVKASELTFAEIQNFELDSADPFSDEESESIELKEGMKLSIKKGVVEGIVTETGIVPLGDDCRLFGDKFATGEFTVVDRGYDKDGEHFPSFCIDKWENTAEEKIPVQYADLLAVNRGLWDSLPKRERLALEVEA